MRCLSLSTKPTLASEGEERRWCALLVTPLKTRSCSSRYLARFVVLLRTLWGSPLEARLEHQQSNQKGNMQGTDSELVTDTQPLILRLGHHACGYHGVVFFHGGRATKVFQRRDGVPSEQVFLSELRAFEIVSTVPELQAVTPRFYGKVDVADVLDRAGHSILGHFCMPVLAYQMEFVQGHFRKVGELVGGEFDAHRALFLKHGIAYTRDCSVTLDDAGAPECVIDFAIEEFELEHAPPGLGVGPASTKWCE